MNILFINGSPNSNGNTAALAKELLQGKEYETLNLTDYSFECNPGVVCKKSVEMILLVYSVITGSSLKPIFRSFGHSTGAGKNRISSKMADSSCAEKAEAGTKPAFGRELSAYL